jgi:hypothetical protein
MKNINRGFGSGPSRKLRLIRQALASLGFKDGHAHGVQRAVYLFPLAKNLREVIADNARPRWSHRSVDAIVDFWKKRWAIPRAERKPDYLQFRADAYIEEMISSFDGIEQKEPAVNI